MARKHSHRKEPNYLLAGSVFIIAIVAIVVVALTSFRGGFTSTDELLVTADRAGLVMEPGAKVKINGVTVGKVSQISTDGDQATLRLAIDPNNFGLIPANAGADIKSSTVFGEKYVSLTGTDAMTGDTPSATPGQTIRANSTATEVNTLFENLIGVMQSIDPAQLNTALGGIAAGLRDRGDQLGQTIEDSNAALQAFNPHWGALAQDIRSTTVVANTYGSAAEQILNLLDNATITSKTIVDQQQNLDGLLVSVIGMGNSGTDLLRSSGSAFVNASRLLVPTTSLLEKYSPEYRCVADQASYNLEYGMGRFGGNTTGYSLDLDVALLLGDNAYRYPQNLPKVGAKGGPKGAPGCYSQITRTNYPAPYLVMDTGASNADATKLEPGTPVFIQYLVGQITGGGKR